ncbi:MAG: fasciclin domain-containing protein [Geminicoccales bacterium]
MRRRKPSHNNWDAPPSPPMEDVVDGELGPARKEGVQDSLPVLHRDQPGVEDWRQPDEEEGQEPLAFNHLDFESRRVDLPCDDDGQVFLAPLRRYEPSTDDDASKPSLDDDVIKPPLETEQATAATHLADQSHDTGADVDLPPIDFGYLSEEVSKAGLAGKADQAGPGEPARKEPNAIEEAMIEPPLEPPSPEAVMIDRPIEDDVTLSPAMQGVQSVQRRMGEEPAGTPVPNHAPLPSTPSFSPLNPPSQHVSAIERPIEDDVALIPAMQGVLSVQQRMGEEPAATPLPNQAPPPSTPFLKALFVGLAAFVRTIFGGIVLATTSFLGGTYRLAALVCTKSYTLMSSVLQLSGQVMTFAASRGWMLTVAMSSIIVTASKIGLGIGSRFAASAIASSHRGIVWSAIHARRHATMLGGWLQIGAKVGLGLIVATGIALLASLRLGLKSAINMTASTWSGLRHHWPAVRMATMQMLRRSGSALAALCSGTTKQFMALNRKSYQFLKSPYGIPLTPLRQVGGLGMSYLGKGKLFVMTTVRQLIASVGPTFAGMTRGHMAGLAASGAGLLLLMTSWSDASPSKRAVVEMPFPPKPLASSLASTYNETLAFEWPSLRALLDDIEARPTPPSAIENPEDIVEPAVEGFLSPDEALANLIQAAAPPDPARLGASDVPSNAVPRTTRSLANGKQSASDLRLITLTLLADIDAIADIGEFAKAVRMVGIETLIEPGLTYTMLAPSDDAFFKLGQDKLDALLDPSGHDELRALLSNHFLSGKLQFSDFAGQISSYRSLANQPITIAATEVIKVDSASMIETDLRAANTVVHVIDEILTPREQPQPAPSETEQASDI